MAQLTTIQRQILQFAKRESFHGKLKDFISEHDVDKDEAVAALKDLKRQRIVYMSPDLMNSFIGVTNHGWSVMGWS